MSSTGYRKEKFKRTVNKRWFSVTMLGAIILVVVLGSLFVLEFEKTKNAEIQTYGDALWLSFQTMTTVGYGDTVPITPGGKVTVVMEMVLGVSLLTGFIGAQASARAEKAQRRAMGMGTKTSLKDHFVIGGWNQRGKYVLQRLARAAKDSGVPIALLCGLDGPPVEDDYVFFYKGNPTSAEDQRRVDIAHAHSVILLADEFTGGDASDVDARTVLAALTALSLNPDLKIVAEVLEADNVQHVRNAGVEEVFDNNMIAGNLLAQSALRFGIIEVVRALAEKDADEKLHRIAVPEDSVGQTCGFVGAELTKKKGYTLIGVRRPDGSQFCDSDTVVNAGDELVILSKGSVPEAKLPDE
jgi:voltage-gated potassium channel